MNPTISVVVPIYNEEGNVRELHSRIHESLNSMGLPFEIIFVDDGSTDHTIEEVKGLTPLTLIRLRKNFGQTAAFDAGFKTARGDIIVTMDGDLQNDPADIPRLLQALEDYDVVSGWRWQRKDTLGKRIVSRGADRLRKLFFKDSIHDSGCALKAYRRAALADLDLFGEMHRFIPALLEAQGFRIGEVKVSHHPRVNGTSKYGNFKRSAKSFVDMIGLWFWGKYSSRPLHLFGTVGLFTALVGVAIILWMAIERIFFGALLAERIWPLMGVLLTFVGIQLFTFGLMMDVTVKNYFRGHRRMNYAVSSITST
jgi:glycosyltransferase involved in cell wall biosynthesis